MKRIEDTAEGAKRRFLISLILLVGGIIYALFPLDIIPDVLGPVGWVDDVGLLMAAFLNAAYAYRKMKGRSSQ